MHRNGAEDRQEKGLLHLSHYLLYPDCPSAYFLLFFVMIVENTEILHSGLVWIPILFTISVSICVRDSVTETVVPTPTAFVFLSMWAKWIYTSVSGNTIVVGSIPGWSIIILRSNFKRNQQENLKDLTRFFKEYASRYGYKYLCTEDDDYKYYQTLGLKLIHKGFFGQYNYGVPLNELEV